MQVCSKIVHKYTLLAVFLFRLRAWCPLCRQIKRFKRVLLFGCTLIPPLRLKSFCVRTQIAKTAHLPAEYIPPTFWLEAPSPFYAGSSWGLLSRKIFFIFSDFVLEFYFFQNPNFNSISFAQYSSSDFSLCIISIDSHCEF